MCSLNFPDSYASFPASWQDSYHKLKDITLFLVLYYVIYKLSAKIQAKQKINVWTMYELLPIFYSDCDAPPFL